VCLTTQTDTDGQPNVHTTQEAHAVRSVERRITRKSVSCAFVHQYECSEPSEDGYPTVLCHLALLGQNSGYRGAVSSVITSMLMRYKNGYSRDVTRLPHEYVDGVELRKTSYVMPWAIYTLPLSSIRDSLPSGELTRDGLGLIADTIDGMIRS